MMNNFSSLQRCIRSCWTSSLEKPRVKKKGVLRKGAQTDTTEDAEDVLDDEINFAINRH